MKLTLKEKKLVKEYAKKLVGKKKLNESDTNWQEIYDSINWDAVGNEILKTFKIKTKLTFKFNPRQKDSGVEMISDNFISQCGIFKYAIDSCELEFFNRSLHNDPSSDVKFWATIHLSYPGNGMNIGTLWVKSDNTIIIKKDTPRSN